MHKCTRGFRSPKTWELKLKWRKIAAREKRKAIKNYQEQKSSGLKKRPTDFYKTFNLFLSSKSNRSHKHFHTD